MKHAREDYARIQDPAADARLLQAFDAAMNALAFGAPNPTEELAELCKAIDGAFGLVELLKNPPAHPIAADEPVFLLRGTDMLTPAVVTEYARQYRHAAPGGHANAEAFEKMVRDHAVNISLWQHANRRKLPDAPLAAGGVS